MRTDEPVRLHAVDVISILTKKREPFTALTVSANAEKAKESPSVFTKIELVYRVTGAVNHKSMEDAVRLSKEKYCSVSAMLEKTAKITFTIEYASRRMILRLFQFALVLVLLVVVAHGLGSDDDALCHPRCGGEGSDFRGMSEADARRKAAADGLEISIDDHFYSAVVPASRMV